MPEFCLTIAQDFSEREAFLEIQRRFPHLETCARSSFKFSNNFLGSMQSGTKQTTIRYVRGAVEYPTNQNLPVFLTSSLDRKLKPNIKIHLLVEIRSVRYKRFGDLDDLDAVRDGFYTSECLKRTLENIYGTIDDEEIVCVFEINAKSRRYRSILNTSRKLLQSRLIGNWITHQLDRHRI